MRRQLFNIAAAVSLLLFTATVVVWVISWQPDGWMASDWFTMSVLGGRYPLLSSEGRLFVFRQTPHGASQLEFVYWPWAALFSVLPAAWLVRRISTRSRSSEGLCDTCGYNLTGNISGVCPECGTPVKGKVATEPP